MLFLEDPIWFSPFTVIGHGNKLRAVLSDDEKRSKQFRKVVEAVSVAQMLIGIIAVEGKEHWMQIVDDKHESPDARTITYADSQPERFDYLDQIDVEVVEYEGHTGELIPEFIVKKKFSDKKSYDDNTVILCHIGGDIDFAHLPGSGEIERIMSAIKTSCQVLLLSALPFKGDGKFQLIQLHPKVGKLVVFDLKEEWEKRKYKKVVHFKKGTRRPPTQSLNTYYPFEKIGYVPKKDGSY